MIDTVKTGANQDATTNGVQTSRSTAHSKSSTSTPSSRHSAGSNGTSRSNGHSVRPHREPTPSANRQLGAKRFRIRWRRLGILLLLIAGALVLGRYGLSWADYRWKYSVTHEASVVGDFTPIGARIDGQIKQLEVRAGERVKHGDLLVKLEDTHLLSRVAVAEARLKRAVKQYDAQEALPGLSATVGITRSHEPISWMGVERCGREAGLVV